MVRVEAVVVAVEDALKEVLGVQRISLWRKKESVSDQRVVEVILAPDGLRSFFKVDRSRHTCVTVDLELHQYLLKFEL